MAAPLVAGAAADTAKQVGAEVKEQVAKFEEDPVAYAGKWSLRIGIGCAAGALGCWIIAGATERAQQQYLNDMDNVLGIAPEMKPTPPKVAPPPPAGPPPMLQAFNAIVGDLAAIDHSNVQKSHDDLIQALKDSIALQDLMYGQAPSNGHWYSNDQATQVPPGGGEGDINDLQIEIMRAAAFLTGSLDVSFDVGSPTDAQRIDSALQPWTAPVGTVPQWGAAYDAIGANAAAGGKNARQYLNNLAADLGFTAPYSFGGSSPAGPWGVVGSFVVGVEAAGSQVQADVSGAVQAVEGAATAFVGDISLVGKALFSLPRLLFDSAGYALSWGANTIAKDAMAPLAIGAVIGIGFGLFARWGWPRLKPRLALAANARTARFWNRWDKRHHVRPDIQQVWTQKSTEAMIHSANENPIFVAPIADPGPVKDTPADPRPAFKTDTGETIPASIRETPEGPLLPPPPDYGGKEHAEPPPPPSETEPEAPGPTPAPENAPAAVSVNPEVSNEPPDVKTPTSAVEAELGEPDLVEAPPPPPVGRKEAARAHAQFAALEVRPGAGEDNAGAILRAVEDSRDGNAPLTKTQAARIVAATRNPEDQHKRDHPGYGKKGRRYTNDFGGSEEYMEGRSE